MRPHVALALAASVAAGCHAELADPHGGSQNAVIDAPVDSVDAPDIDAPIDARVCAGGDARGTDPATGSCFVFFATPAPYAGAVTGCANLGAKLAVIKSAQTNTFVLGLVGAVNATIGATDSGTEGTFIWLENAADPLAAGYTNWRAGEPNNGGGGGVQEDCAVIEGARGGTWDDKPCAVSGTAGAYAYVCQY